MLPPRFAGWPGAAGSSSDGSAGFFMGNLSKDPESFETVEFAGYRVTVQVVADAEVQDAAKRFGNIGEVATNAFRAYAEEVRMGTFPGPEHSYQMPSDEANKLASYLATEKSGRG